MDRLIKELESLANKPDLPSEKIVGAVIATAMRCRDILSARMAGLQALATAIAMQPSIDALRLHDDYLRLLNGQYDSPQQIPESLRDIALAIKLAAADRR